MKFAEKVDRIDLIGWRSIQRSFHVKITSEATHYFGLVLPEDQSRLEELYEFFDAYFAGGESVSFELGDDGYLTFRTTDDEAALLFKLTWINGS